MVVDGQWWNGGGKGWRYWQWRDGGDGGVVHNGDNDNSGGGGGRDRQVVVIQWQWQQQLDSNNLMGMMSGGDKA